MTARPGTVYLVGAGPGDPGLITVRGFELLRRADVVIHDRLVSTALLDEARPDAHVIDVGKTPRAESVDQATINAALVTHARQGQVVVRLKGGDPLVFGRGWEEREACEAAGVPCEIVPGVSSALAAPAAADIPVTCRGVASSVAIVAAPVVDDAHLAGLAHADTCVFLMGMHGLDALTRRLIECGRPADTPAAVIERATLPGQRTVRATLGTLTQAVANADLRAPAVIVVGDVAALGVGTGGRLAGRRVVVTRPTNAAHESARRLRALGAEVVAAPLIEIVYRLPPETSWFERLAEFDWIVFSSRHGVRGFRRAVEALGGSALQLATARIAAVGPITARELESWGIHPHLVPSPARAAELASALINQAAVPRRVLFPCGTLALDSLPTALAVRGIATERLSVYDTCPLDLHPRVRAQLARGFDAVLFASPSAVSAFGRCGIAFGDATAICIGPTTAQAAAAEGWSDVQVAGTHTDEGMVAVLCAARGTDAVAA